MQKQETVSPAAPFMAPSVQLQGLVYFLSLIPYGAHQHGTRFLRAQYFLRGCTMSIHLTLIWDGSIHCNPSASALQTDDHPDRKFPEQAERVHQNPSDEAIPSALTEPSQRQAFAGASPSQGDYTLPVEKPASLYIDYCKQNYSFWQLRS